MKHEIDPHMTNQEIKDLKPKWAKFFILETCGRTENEERTKILPVSDLEYVYGIRGTIEFKKSKP